MNPVDSPSRLETLVGSGIVIIVGILLFFRSEGRIRGIVIVIVAIRFVTLGRCFYR